MSGYKQRKQIEGLKTDRMFLSIIAIICFVGMLILAISAIVLEKKYRELQDENTELQNVLDNFQGIRTSVLFYRCPNEGSDLWTLYNLLIDGNNLSIYDYEIKKGCEVIE